MCYLQGVALDVAGNIYVADTGNSLARMVTRSPTKKDTLIAEFPGSSDNTNDCGPATAAKLQLPFGISADVSGNIYTADSGNSVIRIVAKDTGNISIVAGKSFASGYNGDGESATSSDFFFPVGIFAEGAGNIYVVDLAASTVRKVTGASPNPCTSAPTAVPTSIQTATIIDTDWYANSYTNIVTNRFANSYADSYININTYGCTNIYTNSCAITF